MTGQQTTRPDVAGLASKKGRSELNQENAANGYFSS